MHNAILGTNIWNYSDFKKGFPILFIGILILTLLDTIGFVVRSKLGFDYGILGCGPVIVYLEIGYFTAQRSTRNMAILLCILAGLYNAIANDFLHIIVYALLGPIQLQWSLDSMFIISAVISMVVGGFLGNSGAKYWKYKKISSKPNNT